MMSIHATITSVSSDNVDQRFACVASCFHASREVTICKTWWFFDVVD